MEQRRLRLGDILDDYCPRERRVTNHAVVAMVEEDVKQTRCTTCDAEHAYKGGKEPRRRKKDAASGLYKEVLAGMPEPIDVAHPEPVPVPHVDLAEGVHPLREDREVLGQPRLHFGEGPLDAAALRVVDGGVLGEHLVEAVPLAGVDGAGVADQHLFDRQPLGHLLKVHETTLPENWNTF